MRSLRERLAAVTHTPTTAKPPEKQSERAQNGACFCREHIVPLEGLCGIEHTTLDDVQALDPTFAGERWDVHRLLFLDTETTGLSGGAGTLAFEIGVGFMDARGMVIRQYVMRDYSEEAAMLSALAQLIANFDTVVSFNGKTFDLPLLESRMVMNRIRLRVTQMPHLDLLHAARRVYKLRLGRCNLARLEEAVLGQGREDDLPGAQVPQRYFDYIRTREFALLEDVLRHNLQDVISLAMLTGHLCAAFRAPDMLTHAQDVYGVGRTLLRGGRIRRGRACLKILGHSAMSSQAHWVLASSYKRGCEWAQAEQTWQDMIAKGEGGATPYIELAKYHEHVTRDMSRALRYANGALACVLNRAPLTGEADTEAILRRIARLQGKLHRIQSNPSNPNHPSTPNV